MIVYKDWSKHIRLGNWLYLYSGLLSIAKNTKHKLVLPDYFLWKYLKHPPKIDTNIAYQEVFHFRQWNYTLEELEWIENYFFNNQDKVINVNLGSHLQSFKFFESNLEYVKEMLEFKEEEIQKVKDKYFYLFDKKCIGISIRLGDFKNHGSFYQINSNWYTNALIAEFPDWQDCNIVFFSDDIDECKQLFSGRNFHFAQKNNTHTHTDNFKHYHNDPMEQFILGTLMEGFVISQSTFSMWMAWYVSNKGGKIVHSGENFAGEYKQMYDCTYYYSENWIKYETN